MCGHNIYLPQVLEEHNFPHMHALAITDCPCQIAKEYVHNYPCKTSLWPRSPMSLLHCVGLQGAPLLETNTVWECSGHLGPTGTALESLHALIAP